VGAEACAPAEGWRAALRRPATASWTLAIIALLAALWAGRAFAVTALMAITLSVLLWPTMCRVQRLLRSRVLASLLVVAVAGAATLGLGVVVTAQVTAAAQRTPEVLRLAARDVATLGSAGASTVKRTRYALRELDRSVARVTGTPSETGNRSDEQGSLVTDAAEAAAAWLAEAARAAAGLIVQATVMGMLTFFLLCSGDRMARRVSAWCDGRPSVRGRVAPMVAELAQQMRHYGRVTLITNISIGVAVALVLLPFGVAGAGWWGALAAALHFVPYAGLALLMLLAAAEVYVLHASWVAAGGAVLLIAAIGFVVGAGMAAWLQGRVSRVDSAVVFAGTVFFSVLWGAWGLVLGPLLVVMHAYGRNAAGPAGDHGNAVLSRWPIVRTHNHDVSLPGDEPRGLLHCVLAACPACPSCM
jgi:predicted PurR-regulated permease PerM